MVRRRVHSPAAGVFLLLCLLSCPLYAGQIDMQMFCKPGNTASYVPVNERLEKGLLFRIEHCNQEPSYILGTLHTDDRQVLKQAGGAFRVLGKSKRALFEIIADDKNQKEIIRHMLLPQSDTQGLRGIVGEETFTRLAKALSGLHPDFPEAVLNRYRPWAAAVLLQFPPKADDGVVLDDRLETIAKIHEIPLVGIETVAQQFDAFEGLSAEEQKLMLTDSLEHLDEIISANDKLFALYKARDLKGIEALGNEAFTEISTQELRDKLMEKIITERNAHMAKTLLTYLPEGRNFIAVGALHLPGKDGVLAALEKQGYFIEVVE